MAIFTSDDKQSNGIAAQKAGAATIIAQGTRIKGNITTDCHLHIDGEFEGKIDSKNTVMIGKSGQVDGEIYANKLVVSGKLKGLTESDTVEILSQGRFEGVITSTELVIEKKGVFIGESKLKGMQTATKNATSKSV
ncbi:bactofilin family protein [Helicobacter sp. T3_23-1056]